jgi:hypothetical protein
LIRGCPESCWRATTPDIFRHHTNGAGSPCRRSSR